ncbi:hypothetical protein V6Z11_D07G058200 [Gossypium hirsutum]
MCCFGLEHWVASFGTQIIHNWQNLTKCHVHMNLGCKFEDRWK